MPSLGDIAQIIAAGVLVFNAWQAWRLSHSVKGAVKKIDANEKILKEVQEQTNGLNTQLLAVTSAAKYEEGLKAGKKSPES